MICLYCMPAMGMENGDLAEKSRPLKWTQGNPCVQSNLAVSRTSTGLRDARRSFSARAIYAAHSAVGLARIWRNQAGVLSCRTG